MMRAESSPAEASDPPYFRFAEIVVDTHARTVARDGEPVPLEPKSYAVLLALLRRPGDLVTRDELLDEVWGHRHVTPGVLTRAIAQLRHALGDDPHTPRHIRTRHALGYCFIGTLEPDESDPDAPGLQAPGDSGGADRRDDSHGAPITGGASAPMNRSDRADRVGDPAAAGSTGPAAGRVSSHHRATDVAQPLPNSRHGRRAADPRVGGLLHVVRLFPRVTGKWWLPVALVVAVGLSALAVWSLARRPAGAFEPSVAVLPFAAVGDRAPDSYFAEALAIEMHGALAAEPGLDVVAVRSLQPSDRDPRTLGRRLGVAHVLDARVQREGQRVRVSAWLTDTRTGITRWSGRFDREASNVFDVQGEVAAEVVRALIGFVPGPGARNRLRPTASYAAYDAYLQGIRALAPGGGEPRLEAAGQAFEEALRLDPDFARARAGLCRTEIARVEENLDAAAAARADRACARAAASAPELREVDLALGELRRMRGDYRRAIVHYERALGDAALKVAAHVGLARVRAAMRQPEASERHFQAALRLQPNDAAVHREHGYQRYLDGDLVGAVASYRRATALAPGDERLWSSLGGLLLARGDAAEARQAFERSLAVRPSYAALSNYGSLRYEEREYAEAEKLYRRAAAIHPGDFRVWGNLGDATAAQPGQAARSRPAYEHAARLAREYTRIRDDDAQALALVAWYGANLGQTEQALAALARAETLGTEPGEVAFLGGQVHALLGDRDAAHARLARASTHGIPASRLAASPALRPLVAESLATR